MEIVDGVDAVRAAVREQLRQGVDQIKIMVSGGVASPYDPLDSRQFSLDEIGAAVEEADGVRPLHAGPCLYAGSYHPRREPGRAHHRARQPDRRDSRPS